ncbi:hypothetical protein Tco_1530830 [Tanacetum coccineum]
MFVHNSVHNSDDDEPDPNHVVTFISKLDLSHHLHLHPNDSTTLTIVSIKLKGTENYNVWPCAMLLALEGRNKIGFIDNTCIRSYTDEVLGREWDMVNVVVMGWILNSISEELFLDQIFSKRAFEVWNELKETFDRLDGSVTFNLHHKINSLTQNGSSVVEYFNKLCTMWKQFDALIQLPRCTCHAAEDFKKHNQLMKLMQFLMRLDDSYMQLRSNILSRDPLPDVKGAYVLISSEESHRAITFGNTSRPNNVPRPNNNGNRRTVGGPTLVCEHCDFNGHTIDRCFKLIRRHFKTLSLNELRSPDFNLLSDQEYSEEEVAETMVETMEQYMSKTRADYGSGVARPKIEDNDNFELKGQFLKELRTNTFSGSDHEDAYEHIEKVFEIVDLFHILNITIDQVMFRAFLMSLTGAKSRWLRNEPTEIEEINNFQQEPDENLYQAWEGFKELLMKCPQHYLTEMHEVILFYNVLGIPTRQILDSRAIQAQLNNLGREIKKVNEKVYVAQVGCEQCKGPHYTKDCPLKEEGKTLKEAYYTQFGGPFQGGGYRAAAPGFYQRNNANPSYQERRQSMEDTLSKFMSESAKRHEENSNLIKEIRASTDAAIRNQGASIKTLEIQIGQMSKVLQERGFGSLPSSTEANPRDQVKSISTTIEADSYPIRRIGSSQYAVSTGQNRTLMYETRQTTIPFPSRLNGYYYEEKKGSYGPQFSEAYSEASHINNSIPRKEKDPGSFTLPCFINNVCFDNALVDLGASISLCLS